MSSNPSPSPSEAAYPTPSSDHTPPESIAATLERLSTAVVTALNARDFDFTSETAQELVRHLAPDFKAELDSLPNQNRPRTFEEQKIAWKKRIEQYPDVHFEIVGMDSQVDEKKGRGSVYMSSMFCFQYWPLRESSGRK